MNNIKELTQEAPSNFQYVSSIKMPEEKKDTAGESAFTQRMIRKSGCIRAFCVEQDRQANGAYLTH